MKRLICICAIVLLTVGALAQDHKRLTNLPHLYVNTFTGNPIVSKTQQVLARMWLVDEQDVVTFYDSISIRGRGNSTWNMAKKPYRIKLLKKSKLLGDNHANAKKWTLLANHGDKSMMRNALASYIGDLCGQPFTPAAKFVDLTLNGEYLGNYQLSDQIDVRKKRVNIAEQDYPLTATSNITGGYLVEADGFKDFTNGVNGWYTKKGVPMAVHYPDDEEIDASQLDYIRQFVNNFENSLFTSNYTDADNGYRAYVDSTTLISWYLASEITANPDYVWSMYYYKQRDDDHLYFGPMWDYDIAFNNDNRLTSQDPTHNLMAKVAFANYGLEKWIDRLWSDEWFQRAVYNSYANLYADHLEAKLLNKIDSLNTLLQQSQQLNYQKWNIRTRYLREIVLYSTFGEYVDDLRSFISQRLPALLKAFANRMPDDVDDDETVTPQFIPSDYYYAITNAGTSTVFDLNAEGAVVGNASRQASHSQQWRIIPLQNGFLQLINRMNGLALTDPTTGESTETTNLNAQLTVTKADSTNKAQQWHIVSQGGTYYNLNNRKSRHTANLNGGNAADGTSIISYTNDNRNASSNNRLWAITPVDKTEETGIGDLQDKASLEYALAYDPYSQRLHFGCDDLSALTFMVSVYDQAGHRILQFPASQGCAVDHLPKGLYIVTWYDQGHHSTKFLK
jgi:hypothetical protein